MSETNFENNNLEEKDAIKAQKKKDRIKNVAIAFLAILLVLTFFSNTIQNYSLPMVATQMVQQASISPMIRGTGTVSADDPYNVTVDETRKIASVSKQVGDEVKKGDVLYTLEDAESTELTDAKSKLSELELAYQQELLSGSMSTEATIKVHTGNTDSLETMMSKLQKANEAVVEATKVDAEQQAQVDLLTAQQTYVALLLDNDPESGRTAIANAEYELSKIAITQENNTASISELNTSLTTETAKLKDVDSLRSTRDSAKTALSSAQSSVADQQKKVDEAQAALNENTDTTKTQQLQDNLDLAKELLSTYQSAVSSAQSALSSAQNAYEDAMSANSTINSTISDLKSDLESLNAQQSGLDARSDFLNDIKNQNTRDQALWKNDFDKLLTVANGTKTQTAKALEDVKSDREKLLTDIKEELTLSSMQEQIKSAQKTVDKLTAKAIGASITAPVDGTISSMAYVAGETTKAGEAAAVIQVAGKPMTLSFSVTNDQARKLKVGDTAEPQNAWAYSEFKATLKSIKPDSSDPNGHKQVTFQIESPEVNAGQSVSIQIGETAVSYDMTVPNSAVHEDNNGKFILIIRSQSSPLGNRYVAQRVDVKVEASDDVNSAIVGSLDGYEYVITTTGAPIKSGQLVRLAYGSEVQ